MLILNTELSYLFVIVIVKSFLDLIQFAFQIPGVKSFLSERISQDPLEQFFGRQRQRGGVNENPTCQQFIQNSSALRVVNSIKIDTHKGNTSSNEKDNQKIPVYISTEPLPKRRRMEPQPHIMLEELGNATAKTCTLKSINNSV